MTEIEQLLQISTQELEKQTQSYQNAGLETERVRNENVLEQEIQRIHKESSEIQGVRELGGKGLGENTLNVVQDINEISICLWLSLIFSICGYINYTTLFFALSVIFEYVFANSKKKSLVEQILRRIILTTNIGVILLRLFDLLSVHSLLPSWLWFYHS